MNQFTAMACNRIMRLDLVDLRAASLAASAPSLLPAQRVGAILEVIAVRSVKDGQLWLDIGGQRLPARVASGDSEGPQDGEKLQVRVLRNSPVLALETLSVRKPTTAADTPVISEALRRFVPKQETPALLLANTAWLAENADEAAPLPRTVMQALTRLWEALPTQQTLSNPATLQTAVAKSGAFLEQQLAAGAAPEGDLKALLLNVRDTLRSAGAHPESPHAHHAPHAPTPLANGPLAALPAAPATLALIDRPEQQLNELARQTEGALARLTTTQLASAAPTEAHPQPLLIELPVRVEDRTSMLRLRIEKDGGGANGHEQKDAWTVEAAMDLGVAGGLHARVTLQGRHIGVQLRAESPDVVRQLAARTSELESVLRGAGLTVDRVVCLHGLPAGDSGARAVRLLDVRA